MDWNVILEIIQQVGLGGLAVVGMIYIVVNITKDRKNDDVAKSLNHISDNFLSISKDLKDIVELENRNAEKLNAITTDLAVLLDRTKDDGK